MQSKGGTGRAYLSDVDHGHLWSPGCLAQETSAAIALDELARILGETEAVGGYHERAAWLTLSGSGSCLAESLAAVTAPGGPLDSLTADVLIQYEPTLCTDPSFNTVCGMATRNGFRDRALFRGPDPVILAAQRDLAVLSAYAQWVRA